MTTEPPDTCPICGAAQTPSLYQFVAGFITQIYDCGATFSGPLNVHPDTSWHSPCPNAMTACLRCGATLHPTAREEARDALVAACVELKLADRALDAANEDRTVLDDAWEVIFDASRVAQEKYDAAANAYLATLERQP